MLPIRARLVGSRPGARAYAASLAALPDDLTKLSARVGRIVVYPVKGLGGLEVERARMDARGLVDEATGLADRGMMLARVSPGEGPSGAFDARAVSIRTEAALALTRASLHDGKLVYDAPGLEPIVVPPASLGPHAGPRARILLYEGGPVIEGARVEGPLASWVRALLRAHPRATRRYDPDDVFLVAPAEGVRRRVAEKHRAGQDADTLFGDGGHLLVASASTLAWMNAALRASGSRPVDMQVFRPNVVLDGLPANAEDAVGEIAIRGAQGDVPLILATMCVRCDATRVDLATGEKPDKEPLAFLARERPPRPDDPASATFAVNAVARPAAIGRLLARGDEARVLSERT